MFAPYTSAVPTRNPALGLALVVTGALLFVVNAGVSRVALRAGVEAVSLTTVRVTGTLVVLLLLVLLFRRSALRPPPWPLSLLILGHGFIGVALLQWSYMVAIDRLPVGMALLLEYQAPILVALWARFVQREPVRRRMWLGLLLATLGLAGTVEIWNGLELDLVGVAAGLLAATCLATYFLIGEHGVSALDPWRVILWSFLVGSLALNTVSPVTGIDLGPLDASVPLLGSLGEHRLPLWLVLAWVVVLGTVVPFGMELLALRHLRATVVTLIAMLEPVGVAILGWAWFFESMTPPAVIGGLVVVAGILLAQTARRAHPVVETPHP